MGVRQIEGIVVEGNRIGRTLGIPTANIALAANDTTPNGVYAAEVTLDGVAYPAVVNVGYKPTIDNLAVRGAEVHIIGFEGDLYGRQLCVVLGDFLRGEQRFDSLEELQAQIRQDIEIVKTKIKD